MTAKNKYLAIAGIILLALFVAGVIGIYYVRTNRPKEVETRQTVTGNTSQTIENPDITDHAKAEDTVVTDSGEVKPSNPVDNSDVAETFETPKEMQKVIDENTEDINDQAVIDQLASSYPSNLIPIYKAKNAADSNDIITNTGRPGWTATYGSDADPKEITAFYEDLLKSTQDYKSEKVAETTNITGTVEGCTVDVSVSANNPDQTGLDDNTSVSIFIERQ